MNNRQPDFSRQSGRLQVYLESLTRAAGHAWCLRFASVLWTLTWAEEGSDGPAQHFQLTISACPLRFDLHHSVLPESIVPEAAPLPVFRFLHQSAFHRIAVHLPPQRAQKRRSLGTPV